MKKQISVSGLIFSVIVSLVAGYLIRDSLAMSAEDLREARDTYVRIGWETGREGKPWAAVQRDLDMLWER